MVRPIRRIVAGNDNRGIAVALSDGPSPDVRFDPARPGFAMTRLWVQETTPARAKPRGRVPAGSALHPQGQR